MGDRVSLTRAEAVEILVELVRCPVCFELPTDNVPVCIRGHHICQGCRDQLSKPICHQCRGGFGTARNFVVEELIVIIPLLISLLREPDELANSTAMMTPSTSSNSIATQTDVPMIECRIGYCPERLPAHCVYQHVRDNHIESLFTVNTIRESDGGSCSKTWKLKYDLNKFYDFVLYSQLGLFFVNLNINKDGDLLGALRMANPRRDEDLYYEMALHVPGRPMWEECSGEVQGCSSKCFQVCDYKKRFFARYYEQDFHTLKSWNGQSEETFTLSLFISH